MEQIDTVVVGAGQSGLSTSYLLTKQGISHVVLEAASTVADPWRSGRWDSFWYTEVEKWADEEEFTMASTKDQLRALIERLPDDCTLEDVQYHLYVQQKVERGLEDVHRGRVVSQAEVERRMASQVDRKANWTLAALADLEAAAQDIEA